MSSASDRASRCVFVYNVAPSVKESNLRELFQLCGKVAGLKRQWDTSKNLFGFEIEFEKVSGAQAAAALHGQDLADKAIAVDSTHSELLRRQAEEEARKQYEKQQGAAMNSYFIQTAISALTHANNPHAGTYHTAGVTNNPDALAFEANQKVLRAHLAAQQQHLGLPMVNLSAPPPEPPIQPEANGAQPDPQQDADPAPRELNGKRKGRFDEKMEYGLSKRAAEKPAAAAAEEAREKPKDDEKDAKRSKRGRSGSADGKDGDRRRRRRRDDSRGSDELDRDRRRRTDRRADKDKRHRSRTPPRRERDAKPSRPRRSSPDHRDSRRRRRSSSDDRYRRRR
ncbi:hypothetical protein DIPPA_05183 [Diplonema papillatum]|nr:hypothetical protein DIPPA_05183 [Diplonema papillatum]